MDMQNNIGRKLSRQEACDKALEIFYKAEQDRQEEREREAKSYFGEDCERCKELEKQLLELQEKYDTLDREHYDLKVEYSDLWFEYDTISTRYRILVELSNWKDVSVDFKLKEASAKLTTHPFPT